jgi:hypothetical protein
MINLNSKLPFNCIDYSPGYGTIGRTWRSDYRSIRNSLLSEIIAPVNHWRLVVTKGKLLGYTAQRSHFEDDPVIEKILASVDGAKIVETSQIALLYIPDDDDTKTLLHLIF